MSTFLPLFISIIVSYLIIYLSKKYSIGETPRQDRWHTSFTPKFGGVAIFLGFTLSIFFQGIFTDYVFNILLIGTLIFFTGLLDDIISLKPVTKMLVIIIIGVFINFWPIVPFGNFYNNWLSILIYLPIGFLLYFRKKNDQ